MIAWLRLSAAERGVPVVVRLDSPATARGFYARREFTRCWQRVWGTANEHASAESGGDRAGRGSALHRDVGDGDHARGRDHLSPGRALRTARRAAAHGGAAYGRVVRDLCGRVVFPAVLPPLGASCGERASGRPGTPAAAA